MAIRLVDQYPNRVGAPDSDYPHGVPRNRSAVGATDGTPYEQAWYRDQEGFFQGLLETAGITPSGNPDTVETSDYLDASTVMAHGVLEVDVAGDQDVTLGIYASRVAALRLTGGLAADVDLIVPDTERLYTIIDETSGDFSVTVRTDTGTGVTLGDEITVLRSDGADVVNGGASLAMQNIEIFDTAGVTEWDVPAVLRSGLRKAKVTVIGGGAGGGRTFETSGGGGGGGGTAESYIDLNSVSTVTITVGSGGEGRTSGEGSGPGQDGETSSFGAFLSATGGIGSQQQGGEGGAGVGGDHNSSLGPGMPSSTSETTSGSVVFVAGAGGGPGGGGHHLDNDNVPGTNAIGPGGGGGGSVGSSDAGDGASGIVIVEW